MHIRRQVFSREFPEGGAEYESRFWGSSKPLAALRQANLWISRSAKCRKFRGERFTRKSEQWFSGGDAIPSTTGADGLLRGRWLKELVINGHTHLATTAQVSPRDLAHICQESLEIGNILPNVDDYARSPAEKLA